MDDDSLRLVLHHACEQRIERSLNQTIHAMVGINEYHWDVEIFTEDKDTPIIVGVGAIGREETILVSHELRPRGEVVAVRPAELEKANADANDYDLCLQDTIGGDAYEDARIADGEPIDARPVRYPCLGWGRRKRLTYTLALSRSVRTTIAFDVMVVPTSWWADDCEGTYWVIQMIHPGETRVKAAEPTFGYSVVGWKCDATE